MIIWFILVFSVLSSPSIGETNFECGSHGRFEYCIDGSPDCIIGCHCHPGYYFDTATKICEPSIKLTQNRRQQHESSPIHTPLSQVDSPEVVEQSTSFPTTGALEDHVDAIAKNADDLGDWLYNQFYKTIENQIINKTNGNLLTRRSGNDPQSIKNKKRKHKKEKRGSDKRKLNKEDLRRKLLRITEDDSLFDSNTDADSSDSSSSDETRESGDKGHGHKKFVIVNKKPKPPLPSFIFLPNIETPYYPPIGLPPPALPMYPMVPVPPVLPAYPLPHLLPNCDDPGTSNTSVSTSSAIKITKETASPQSDTTETAFKPDLTTTTKSSIDIDLTTATESIQKVLRSRKRNKKHHMRSGGKDMLHRLQELVKNNIKNSANKKNLQNTQVIPTEDLNGDTLEIDETNPAEFIKNDNIQLRTNDQTPLQEGDTVDFKYLSQLIHRMDLNNTGKRIGEEQTKQNIKNLKHNNELHKKNRNHNSYSQIVQPSRRYNVQKAPLDSKKSDNTFYENLGRQIATLIRGVDSKNDRQINIEIEHMDHNPSSHPIFNELSYAPHSYWERFVRSPMDYLQRYEKKTEDLKKSNEILNNIEDKVEIAASTMTPMSLLEIENVINIMEGAQNEVQRKYLHPPNQLANNTLNINLWPQNLSTNNAFINSPKPIGRKVQKYFNNTMEHKNNNLNSNLNSLCIQNIHKFTTWINTEDTVNNIFNKKRIYTKQNKKYDDVNKMFSTKNTKQSMANPPNVPNFVNIPTTGSISPPTRRTNLQYQDMSPLFDYNQKQFFGLNNQHPFYNHLLEFKFPTVAKSVKKPLLRTVGPSYFHHEAHHYDYIN